MSADLRRFPTWRGFTGVVVSVGPEDLPRVTRAVEDEVCRQCGAVGEWDEVVPAAEKTMYRTFVCRGCGRERHEWTGSRERSP